MPTCRWVGIEQMTSSGVRLADLITAMSLATDLGLGQPPEHMLRAASISMRMGQRLGLGTAELCTLYDVSVLTYVGCSVFGDTGARMFGDDIDFRARAAEVDLGGFSAMIFMLRRAGAGAGAYERTRQTLVLAMTGGRAVIEQMAGHCSAAGLLAAGLGLSEDVRAGIEQSYARWDGRGVPSELAGDGISLAARISHIAEAAEALQRTGGTAAALDVIGARSGSHFDPELVAVVQRDPTAMFRGLEEVEVADVLDLEPVKRPPLTDEELDGALAAIGDFCDLRCAWFAGHAAGTARLAEAAATALGLPVEEQRLVRRAALIHDVGRFGVPGQVWARTTALSAHDRERMRMHAYYVERIFTQPEPLRRIGILAATHHERMDGSGYHRGLTAPLLSRPARILAAADAYQAMLEPRPHRPAMTAEQAAAELHRDVAAGRLDAGAADAVLAADGQATGRARSHRPAGLTEREIEVVALLAAGLPNKSIASRLGISTKTVGNHVEHAYSKLGVTNRAGATLQAMRLGLLDRRLAPGDDGP